LSCLGKQEFFLCLPFVKRKRFFCGAKISPSPFIKARDWEKPSDHVPVMIDVAV
jgi:hypothetical protein